MFAQAVLREKVLERGLHLASAQGLQTLTVSELARELNVPRSGLSRLFANPQCLQLAVLEQAATRFIKEVIEPAQQVPAGERRLHSLFRSWINWARADRLEGGCPFVQASREADRLDSKVGSQLESFLATWRDELHGAIEAAKEPEAAGRFRADLDTEQFIFELFGLYLSHHFWHWSMHDIQAEWRTMKAFERLLETARA